MSSENTNYRVYSRLLQKIDPMFEVLEVVVNVKRPLPELLCLIYFSCAL